MRDFAKLLKAQFRGGLAFGLFGHYAAHLDIGPAGCEAVNGGTGGSDQVILKRIRALGKGQGHVYGVFGDFYRMDQAQRHYILVATAGMLHAPQAAKYFFFT